MKLFAHNGVVPPASFFKFAFVGVLIGEGLFVLLFLAPIFALTFAGPFTSLDPSARQFYWIVPVMLPVIVMMHALIFGGMITLGLWLYSRWRKIEIVEGP
jgi:hypothetical protein